MNSGTKPFPRSYFACKNFFEYTSIRKESQSTPLHSPGNSIRTVLVTGGTGFIGSHTVEHLLAQGFNVRCLVRPNRKNLRWLEGLSVEAVSADVFDPSSLPKALEGVEYVFHIAGVTKAKRRAEFFLGNTKATENLLLATAKYGAIKKFCYVSSLTVVGPSLDGTPLDESAPCRPISTYAQSKAEAEGLCRKFSDRVPMVIIRPPAVYGPRDTDILETFRWVGHGIRPLIGSRDKTLSMVYGPELAKGIIQATLSQKTEGETYFISDEVIYRYADLIEIVARLVRNRTVAVRFPSGLLYTFGGIAEFVSILRSRPALLSVEKAKDLLQPHWVCSPKKIKEHIGFATSVPIEEGMAKTYQWYKENNWM